jgi:nicotinamide-nucleotide amidase
VKSIDPAGFACCLIEHQKSESMSDNNGALEVIRKNLVKADETLGVAESVTAGNLQAELSLAKEAIEFFHGGLTLYNIGQKARHLLVDPIVAERTNCVSDRIAQSMAVGACIFFSSDWGVGITGYAAPVPEWKVMDVLFAWYSIAYRGAVVATKKIEIKKMPMDKAQRHYVKVLLDDFASMLKSRK